MQIEYSEETKKYFQLVQKLHGRLDRMIAACHECTTLKGRLEYLKEDLIYTPPEAIGSLGTKVENALYSQFGENPPTEGWGKEVVDAWISPL